MRIILSWFVSVAVTSAIFAAAESQNTPQDPPLLVVTASATGDADCAYAFTGTQGWTLSAPQGDQSGAFCRRQDGGLGWSPDHNRGLFVIIVRGVYGTRADSPVDQVGVEITVPED